MGTPGVPPFFLSQGPPMYPSTQGFFQPVPPTAQAPMYTVSQSPVYAVPPVPPVVFPVAQSTASATHFSNQEPYPYQPNYYPRDTNKAEYYSTTSQYVNNNNQPWGNTAPTMPTNSDTISKVASANRNSFGGGDLGIFREHLFRLFAKIIKEHGPQESTGQDMLTAFLRLGSQERKYIMSHGTLGDFLSSSPYLCKGSAGKLYLKQPDERGLEEVVVLNGDDDRMFEQVANSHGIKIERPKPKDKGSHTNQEKDHNGNEHKTISSVSEDDSVPQKQQFQTTVSQDSFEFKARMNGIRIEKPSTLYTWENKKTCKKDNTENQTGLCEVIVDNDSKVLNTSDDETVITDVENKDVVSDEKTKVDGQVNSEVYTSFDALKLSMRNAKAKSLAEMCNNTIKSQLKSNVNFAIKGHPLLDSFCNDDEESADEESDEETYEVDGSFDPISDADVGVANGESKNQSGCEVPELGDANELLKEICDERVAKPEILNDENVEEKTKSKDCVTASSIENCALSHQKCTDLVTIEDAIRDYRVDLQVCESNQTESDALIKSAKSLVLKVLEDTYVNILCEAYAAEKQSSSDVSVNIDSEENEVSEIIDENYKVEEKSKKKKTNWIKLDLTGWDMYGSKSKEMGIKPVKCMASTRDGLSKKLTVASQIGDSTKSMSNQSRSQNPLSFVQPGNSNVPKIESIPPPVLYTHLNVSAPPFYGWKAINNNPQNSSKSLHQSLPKTKEAPSSGLLSVPLHSGQSPILTSPPLMMAKTSSLSVQSPVFKPRSPLTFLDNTLAHSGSKTADDQKVETGKRLEGDGSPCAKPVDVKDASVSAKPKMHDIGYQHSPDTRDCCVNTVESGSSCETDVEMEVKHTSSVQTQTDLLESSLKVPVHLTSLDSKLSVWTRGTNTESSMATNEIRYQNAVKRAVEAEVKVLQIQAHLCINELIQMLYDTEMSYVKQCRLFRCSDLEQKKINEQYQNSVYQLKEEISRVQVLYESNVQALQDGLELSLLPEITFSLPAFAKQQVFTASQIHPESIPSSLQDVQLPNVPKSDLLPPLYDRQDCNTCLQTVSPQNSCSPVHQYSSLQSPVKSPMAYSVQTNTKCKAQFLQNNSSSVLLTRSPVKRERSISSEKQEKLPKKDGMSALETVDDAMRKPPGLCSVQEPDHSHLPASPEMTRRRVLAKWSPEKMAKMEGFNITDSESDRISVCSSGNRPLTKRMKTVSESTNASVEPDLETAPLDGHPNEMVDLAVAQQSQQFGVSDVNVPHPKQDIGTSCNPVLVQLIMNQLAQMNPQLMMNPMLLQMMAMQHAVAVQQMQEVEQDCTIGQQGYFGQDSTTGQQDHLGQDNTSGQQNIGKRQGHFGQNGTSGQKDMYSGKQQDYFEHDSATGQQNSRKQQDHFGQDGIGQQSHSGQDGNSGQDGGNPTKVECDLKTIFLENSTVGVESDTITKGFVQERTKSFLSDSSRSNNSSPFSVTFSDSTDTSSSLKSLTTDCTVQSTEGKPNIGQSLVSDADTRNADGPLFSREDTVMSAQQNLLSGLENQSYGNRTSYLTVVDSNESSVQSTKSSQPGIALKRRNNQTAHQGYPFSLSSHVDTNFGRSTPDNWDDELDEFDKNSGASHQVRCFSAKPEPPLSYEKALRSSTLDYPHVRNTETSKRGTSKLKLVAMPVTKQVQPLLGAASSRSTVQVTKQKQWGTVKSGRATAPVPVLNQYREDTKNSEISSIDLKMKRDHSCDQETEDKENWTQVSKKKKKTKLEPGPVSKPQSTVSNQRSKVSDLRSSALQRSIPGLAVSTPVKGATTNSAAVKANNFEKLVNRLSEAFPQTNRSETIEIIKEVRQKHGGLNGLTMKQILDDAQHVVQAIQLKKLSGKTMFSYIEAALPNEDKKPGSDMASIFIPSYVNTSNQFQAIDDDEDGVMCVICCDNIKETESKVLDCGHEFHDECIKRWVLGEDRTCPTCRSHALFPEEFPKLTKQ